MILPMAAKGDYRNGTESMMQKLLIVFFVLWLRSRLPW